MWVGAQRQAPQSFLLQLQGNWWPVEKHHPYCQQQRRSPAAPGMTLEGQPIGQGAATSKMHTPPLGSLSRMQGGGLVDSGPSAPNTSLSPAHLLRLETLLQALSFFARMKTKAADHS